MHVSFSLCFDAFYVNYMRERRKDPLLQHAANLVSHLTTCAIGFIKCGSARKANPTKII